MDILHSTIFIDSVTSLQRRNSSNSLGKENAIPPASFLMPPPDLSEETLMAPEHNEIVAKLKFISMLVDTIIDVARCKAAPLSAITESVSPKNSPASQGGLDSSSPHHRKLQQLLLYMRCLHLLSQTLDLNNICNLPKSLMSEIRPCISTNFLFHLATLHLFKRNLESKA